MTNIVLKCPSCGHMIDFGPNWIPIDVSVSKANGDVLRERSNEALAIHYASLDACPDAKHERNCNNECYECWLDWLNSPIGDDENG